MKPVNTKAPKKEYAHLPLNTPMEMGCSSYWVSCEERVRLDGREALVIVRDTDCITSCCGQSQGFRSIGVIGYVVEWRSKTRDGLPVSLVEPVIDEADRHRLTRILRQEYKVTQVGFL